MVLLARSDEDRGTALFGIKEHAEGVAETRRGVEVYGRESSRRLGETVGNGEDDRLLEGKYIPHSAIATERIHQRQLGRPRISDQQVHSLLDEQLDQRRAALDRHYVSLFPAVRQRLRPVRTIGPCGFIRDPFGGNRLLRRVLGRFSHDHNDRGPPAERKTWT